MDKEPQIKQDTDQDSDFLYVTAQPTIVDHARSCYLNYPTIVNNIGKDTTVYDNTPDDFSVLDSKLAKSQRDIGESSNLAQLAQTYASSFGLQKYDDYVCILSVIAQISIDSAKRSFSVDVSKEISRIKKDMDVDVNGYPAFWFGIKKGCNKKLLNNDLDCPMNKLYLFKPPNGKSPLNVINISEFFIDVPLRGNRRTSRKVEELIEKYSLEYWKTIRANSNISEEDWFMVRSDFDELIEDIRRVSISLNYRELMSWLINRALRITPEAEASSDEVQSSMNKNRSLLLKTLYTLNPDVFLSCFVRK